MSYTRVRSMRSNRYPLGCGCSMRGLGTELSELTPEQREAIIRSPSTSASVRNYLVALRAAEAHAMAPPEPQPAPEGVGTPALVALAAAAVVAAGGFGWWFMRRRST